MRPLTRVVLNGNRGLASEYVHEASLLQFQLHEQLKLNTDVKQRQVVRIFPDGTVIKVQSVFGRDIVTIESPRVPIIEEELPRISSVPVMAQYLLGKVFFKVAAYPEKSWFIDVQALTGLTTLGDSDSVQQFHSMATVEYDPRHGVVIFKTGTFTPYTLHFVALKFFVKGILEETASPLGSDELYHKADIDYSISSYDDPQVNFPASVNPALPRWGLSQIKGIQCWLNDGFTGIDNIRWEVCMETLTQIAFMGEPYVYPVKTVSIMNQFGAVTYANPYWFSDDATSAHVLAALGSMRPNQSVSWGYLLSHFRIGYQPQRLSVNIGGVDLQLADHTSIIMEGTPYYNYMGHNAIYMGGLLFTATGLSPWCGSVMGGDYDASRYSMILGLHCTNSLSLPPAETFSTEPGKSNRIGYFVNGTYYPEGTTLPPTIILPRPAGKVGKELWDAERYLQISDVPTLTGSGYQVSNPGTISVSVQGIHPDYPEDALTGLAFYQANLSHNSGDLIGRWLSGFSFACIDVRDLP